MKGQSFELPSANDRPRLQDLNLSALGYSPLALLSPAVSPAWGRSVFGHDACRLVVGPEVVRGRGDCLLGGFMGGARPSSGEDADGDGAAAAAERPGPASGPVAAASVTPLPPHWADRARVGDPRRPAPLSPNTIPSPSPPQPARARSCLR